ncbi:MAG: HlyD family efflux transporter periplasmic adaptor subunit [Oscillospiraceae bacterium]|nr:HlyD family efflux transporter periplasmic adaptor subunit [Oscillospiraceae bacterium]
MKFITKNIKALLGLLLVLSVLIVTVALAIAANRKEPPVPRTAAAEKRDLVQTVGAVGTIRCASGETVLYTIPCPVGAVAVQTGDPVKQGDLLFCYDTEKLDADIAECEKLLQNLESAEMQAQTDSQAQQQRTNELLLRAADQAAAQYQNALLTLADAKSALDSGRTEYENWITEHPVSDDPADAAKTAALQNQCERYETIFAEAEAAAERWKEQKSAADETLRQTKDSEQYSAALQKFTASASESCRQQLLQLQAMRTQTEVKAPCSGVITEMLCETGESGRQYTPAVQIGSTDAFEAVLTVSAETRAKLCTGMQVWVTPATAPEQSADGIITDIRLGSGNAYQTVISVDPAANDLLRSGSPCSGRIILQRADQTLCVPYDAVCTDETGEYVWRMDAGNPVRQPVRTGLHCDYYTEIIGDGALHPDDTVLLNPAEVLGKDAL